MQFFASFDTKASDDVKYKKVTTKKDHPFGEYSIELVDERQVGGDELPKEGSNAVLKANGKVILEFTYENLAKGDKELADFRAVKTKIKDPDEVANILVSYVLA